MLVQWIALPSDTLGPYKLVQEAVSVWAQRNRMRRSHFPNILMAARKQLCCKHRPFSLRKKKDGRVWSPQAQGRKKPKPEWNCPWWGGLGRPQRVGETGPQAAFPSASGMWNPYHSLSVLVSRCVWARTCL